jgi:nitrate reductase NapD
MPISGIVVACAQEQAEALASQISALAGLEVHGVLPDGKIVAVIETDTVDAEVQLVSQLHEIPGVATVNLAYHNFEDI